MEQPTTVEQAPQVKQTFPVTFHGLHEWHKHLFEVFGWMKLATVHDKEGSKDTGDDHDDKLKGYDESINNFIIKCENKISTTVDQDRKADLQTLLNHVRQLDEWVNIEAGTGKVVISGGKKKKGSKKSSKKSKKGSKKQKGGNIVAVLEGGKKKKGSKKGSKKASKKSSKKGSKKSSKKGSKKMMGGKKKGSKKASKKSSKKASKKASKKGSKKGSKKM